MHTEAKLTSGQSVYLDLLRGLSAVAVLLGHAVALLPSQPKFGTFYPIQSYAVAIFFILSGLLICYSTVRKRDYTYSDYMIDRFSRIYVALFPTLIFILLVDHFVGQAPREPDAPTILGNLAMLMGVPFDRAVPLSLTIPPLGSGRPLWTVAVEWWLYVGFGFVFFIARMKPAELVVSLLLLAPAMSVLYLYGTMESLALVWILAAALAIPALMLNKQACERVALPLLLVFAALLASRLARLHGGAERINFYDLQLLYCTTSVFFSGLLLVKAYEPVEKALLFIKPVSTWLAAISYPLYLTHYTILSAVKVRIGDGWGSLLLACTIAILVAWLFTFLFDSRYRAVGNALKSLAAGGPRRHRSIRRASVADRS